MGDWEEPDFEQDPDQDPDFDQNQDIVEVEELPPRDHVVDEAKEELEGFFAGNSKSVFYQRQLQVIFEDNFFHWITARALSELVEERKIASEVLPLPGTGTITMYHALRHRYWHRQAKEIIDLVSRFSVPAFAKALGAHGELMFDAALPRVGFIPTGINVRSYGGKTWTATGHDLDRIFERDGIAYGTEIKNTLRYIDRGELRVKLLMCSYLGIRPLFIVRMAPKNYIFDVHQQGGYTLVVKYQLYPFGEKAFADTVKARLGLWTDSPVRIEDGTVQRFLNWHLKKLQGSGD
jgi:hypothetical protein